MDWFAAVQPFLLAIIGGLTAHLLAYRRDRRSFDEARQREREVRRRERRTEYLKDAYFDLLHAEFYFADVSHRASDPAEHDDVTRRFNRAFNGILIYGTAEQAEMLWDVTRTFQDTGRLDLGALTNAIRQDLRAEIGNEPLRNEYPVLLLNPRRPES